MRRLTSGLLTALLMVTALTSAASPSAADTGTEPPQTGQGDPIDVQTVSLLTGDLIQVETFADDRRAVTVEVAPRDGYEPTYDKVEFGDDLYVIPSDAAAYVPGTLDRELFNVTKLVQYPGADTLPVMIDPQDTRQPEALETTPNLHPTTTYTNTDTVAAEIDTSSGEWWAAVRAAESPGSMESADSAVLEGTERIWLDELFEAHLVDSVPQVGAPAAWDMGFDGSGLSVAVLDTGIDADHPALAGRVVEEENFTSSDTAGDVHGHGTHVAGIVGGAGIASDGDHIGVAPGADLINGKVLGDTGSGLESQIMEGMEWAAEAGADIINMSLGGGITDGADPMSVLLDELSTEHDVLFVTSAGNDGPGDHTVSRPATASEALAVGSVDSDDELSDFSSVGPREGDFAIKPEITAPGEAIVAPRAAEADIGEPVDGHYTALSGTSMAAPHVAGAAAILLEAESDLSSSELGTLLSATGEPHPDPDVYQQGGGRLDIVTALEAPVRVDQAPVSLGHFEYPQDDTPVHSEDVTYSNVSDSTIDLDLDLDVSSRDGDAPGEDMISIEPTQLTLEPGETAQVTITLDVTVGEAGLYGGYLTAVADSETVLRTPVGFHKEDEHYELTFEVLGRDGVVPNPTSEVHVLHTEDGGQLASHRRISEPVEDGMATVRMPQGEYMVIATINSAPDSSTLRTIMIEDGVELTEDTTLTFDADVGNLVSIDTPEHPDAEVVIASNGVFYRPENGGGSVQLDLGSTTIPTYVEASDPVTTGEFGYYSKFRLAEPGAGPSPYLYDLVLPTDDRLPDEVSYTVQTDDMVVVDNRFHSDVQDNGQAETRSTWRPWQATSVNSLRSLGGEPFERREYLISDETTRYRQSVTSGDRFRGQMREPHTHYQPGEHRTQNWFQQVFRPGILDGGEHRQSVPMVREGDEMWFELMSWMDSGNRYGQPGGSDMEHDTYEYRFYEDGELVREGSTPHDVTVPLSVDPAEHRLELDITRDVEWWTTSTATQTAWTLQSEEPPAGERVAVPLMELDYDVDVDLLNVAPAPADRRGPFTVDIHARHQVEAEGAPIEEVRLWASYDDGETWGERPGRPVGGDGEYSFVLDNRNTVDGYVSLRVEAQDTDGNAIEQEITRALALPNR